MGTATHLAIPVVYAGFCLQRTDAEVAAALRRDVVESATVNPSKPLLRSCSYRLENFDSR